MHEASIAEAVIRTVQKAVPRPEARVTQVTIVVGVLAGVQTESLRFCFEEFARGTRLEGARLVLTREPALLTCRACGPNGNYDGAGPVPVKCGRCGGAQNLEGGHALYVDNVEIEE